MRVFRPRLQASCSGTPPRPRRGLRVVIGLTVFFAATGSPSVALATFGGAGFTNGYVAFDGNCNSGNQQILDINPSTVGTPPPSCTGYGQQTTVGTDANPFYSADTATVYFASSRNNQWQIFSIPSNFGGTATDGATKLTAPAAQMNDFAPTVSTDGTTMAFVRCSSATTCNLETMNLGTSAVTQETTDNPLTPVNNTTTGETDRPEFNPVATAGGNGQELLYECTVTVSGTQYDHICVHRIGHTVPDIDLSNQAHGSSPWAHTDENPDFKYDGSSIVFDTSGDLAGPNVIYRMAFDGTSASAAGRIWPTATGQGHEIDPIYSPDGTQYVWAEYGSGTYLFDWGSAFSQAVQISPSGKNINSQPTWEGGATQAIVSESHYAVLLPLGALVLVVGAFAYGWRRRAGSGDDS